MTGCCLLFAEGCIDGGLRLSQFLGLTERFFQFLVLGLLLSTAAHAGQITIAAASDLKFAMDEIAASFGGEAGSALSSSAAGRARPHIWRGSR